MHELAVVQGIIDMAGAAAQGRRIFVITVEIGKESCISFEALRFGFSLAAEGTAAEGAELAIRPVPGGDLLVKSIEIEEAA